MISDDIDGFKEVIKNQEFNREIELSNNLKDEISFKIEINELSEGRIRLELYSR